MAFKLADGIYEQATTPTGTGASTVTGAVLGYKSFSSFLSVGDTFWGTRSMGADFETGLFTYSSANTVTLTTVFESTNGNAAVSWAAGTKDIICDLPASRIFTDFVRTIKVQKFTANGTYTPSPGMLYCVIRAVGGGGGGGGATGSTGGIYSGAGGSAGTYTEGLFTAADIGASKNVTIGAAGTGGAAGSNSGVAGGTTILGANILTAPGGGGGLFGSSISIPSAGSAGAAGTFPTGGYTVQGSQGLVGIYAQITSFLPASGFGANSLLGTGAAGVVGNSSAVNGAVATSAGGGGSGGISHNTTSTAAGGNGNSGMLLVLEHCAY